MKRRGDCAAALLVALVAAALGGCTAESTRVALAAQQRANDVQQTVFERQHEGLRILLYRDLVAQLERAGGALSAAQRAALNDAWNERDLVEFWAIQQERAAALRTAGVDAKLYADQSIVDLLMKSVAARADRLAQGLAAAAGTALPASEAEEPTETGDR